MQTIRTLARKAILAATILWSLPTLLQAWEPNAKDLDAAITTGDFAGYLAGVTAWLDQKAPAVEPSETAAAALAKLFNDPGFANALDQRQLIIKTGAKQLGAFAKANPERRAFLGWLLKNTQALDLYLEGAVPVGLAAREQNGYALPLAALEIWAKIFSADPDSKEGLCLRLAVATALRPPGTGNRGAGMQTTPTDPLVRYQYFKAAHNNKELFPSFDHLTVWEYQHVVSSCASETDLTWARDMINTFRPDLRADELVVNSTSFVWRRAAPANFYPNGGYQNFKNVLAGGGKCGPRSSWAVMVCQAFGIPAIGVGQPAHACVAYKAANPMTQPQPGSAWKVAYGRGWEVSTLEGMKGPDFLAGVEKRTDLEKFSRVEHLRWLASALASSDKASAVMAIARKIDDSITAPKTDLSASLKADEADADPGVKAGANAGQPKAPPAASANHLEQPIRAVSGAMHVEAASYARTGGKISWGGQIPHVLVHDCFTGGKQVYFQQQMKEQWADYTLDIPASGAYQISMKAACVNEDQLLEVCSGARVIAAVPIPLSYGLWEETQPVELKLDGGLQTIRVQTPISVNAENHKRGIALRCFDLKPKR